jgi:glycine dehydrogenase
MKSFIGQGYYGTHTPPVLLRNMLENPQWYTAYTPYQAEISQGRLEMLLNFQTMVSDLTKMEISNCSLLDEGSAAGEALNMCDAIAKHKRRVFFVDKNCHPQTIGCVKTRGSNMGVEVVVGDAKTFITNPNEAKKYCGVLIQYPNTFGSLSLGGNASSSELDDLSRSLTNGDCKLVVATDLLALTLARAPGEFGADIVVGSAQRFGVPMFYGGPHAGFMATKQTYVRHMPGRIIGVSKDSSGRSALRMALQTREQFIKREKATSNICTAQALLANIAAAYGIYHGPEGLTKIAQHVATKARNILTQAEKLGYKNEFPGAPFFDTITLRIPSNNKATVEGISKLGEEKGINVRVINSQMIGISTDETTSDTDVQTLVQVLAQAVGGKVSSTVVTSTATVQTLGRTSSFMTHPVFHQHRSETQMLRYLTSLEAKDLTLRQAMIPLGSCTMKLNAAAELLPVSWPEFSSMHPFAPAHQAQGFRLMIDQLNSWLASLTGFDAVSSQPNSGATGEYAGLLAIKRYHESNNQGHRNVCLIPVSAHGTNPASAAMCNMKVVGVKSDAEGNVDLVDLKSKAEEHQKNLACMMITYPSTYGKFEERVKEAIDIIHKNGGQVYMDGANMNAQLGHTSPGRIGADVCHLNLHKSFAIPHGGGGPGVGSIGVRKHLIPYLPGHVVQPTTPSSSSKQKPREDGAVAAAPFGSAGILPIPWMFIRMLGRSGIKQASSVAMLNANYMAKRLEQGGYKILYKGTNGLVAHEFILDLSHLKDFGLDEGDVAKRLADYGFHAPTMSWPVHHTMMVEPTESEDKGECTRFVEAMLLIKKEIDQVARGEIKAEDSPLRHAPHTADVVISDKWNRKYSREQAVFPAPPPLGVKYWPSVGRVDSVFGDRNLVCACPTVEELMEKN